jgi:hypothetical protein
MNQAEHCLERENLQMGFVEQELAIVLESVTEMALVSLLTVVMALELAMGMALVLGMALALLLTVVFSLELVTVEVSESPLF